MRTEVYNVLIRGLTVSTIVGLAVVIAGCSALAPGGSQPPSQTRMVSASDGTATDRIVVSWGSIPEATSFKIYRADSLDGAYTLLATTDNVTTWTDKGLAVDVHHWYRVEACNRAGCGPQSAPDEGYTKAVPPGIPVSVSATDATSPDTIRVVWKQVAGASSYRIYRADALDGAYELRASSEAASWKDDGLQDGVHHWYRVAACNVVGCSAQSQADEGSTSVAAPGAPAWVIAGDGVHSDTIEVTWSQVPGATGYDVYRAPSYSGNYALLATVTDGTSHEDAGVGADMHYWYKVRACNRAGCGPLSATDEGSTSAVAPATPTQPSATDGLYAYRIDVSWAVVAGATSYNVYRATPPDTTYGFRATVLGGGVSAWTDGDVVPGTSYKYRIRACNLVGCSDLSPEEAGSTSP